MEREKNEFVNVEKNLTHFIIVVCETKLTVFCTLCVILLGFSCFFVCNILWDMFKRVTYATLEFYNNKKKHHAKLLIFAPCFRGV